MKKFMLALGGLSLLGIIALCIIAAWALKLKSSMEASLESGWFLPPTQVYTGQVTLYSGQSITAPGLIQKFENLDWTERGINQSIFDKEFTLIPFSSCQSKVDIELPSSAYNCLVFKDKHQQGILVLGRQSIEEILIFKEGLILKEDQVQIGVSLFAQFINGKAVRQNYTPISQIPTQCLDAIVAIEDNRFLEHRGVSPRAILRAFVRNIRAGRLSEGGSTITQQLIKNKFLSSKKTLARKAQEALMALVLELSVDKNKILESYLNIIYMGQDGPYEVRGFAAASKFYFGKEIANLSLRECASLAASVKSPGLYGPHKKNNKERTDLVLTRMHELKWISKKQVKNSLKKELKLQTNTKDEFLAHYFIDAVNKFLKKENIDQSQGIKVYTTLSPEHQKLAEATALKRIRKLKKDIKDSQKLEGLIVSANPKTGEVLALVGGSDFKTSPYNRVLKNFRPIGSLMKPFVYLSALKQQSKINPLSLFSNSRFTYNDHGKKWSPHNYNKRNLGGYVYMFQSLMLSMNIPTARIGLEQTNPQNIIDLVVSLGGPEGRLKPYPSITLGTFEFYPLEVLQLYTSLSQMGTAPPIHFIKSVKNLKGKSLWSLDKNSQELEPIFTQQEKAKAAEVIGMLKNTLKYGTARSSQAWKLKGVYAGKTGTTSFHKDSWFAGFSEEHVAITWVGYDEGQGERLTGAGTALPLWLDYIKAREANGHIPSDFEWPNNVSEKYYSAGQLNDKTDELFTPVPDQGVYLIMDENN